MLLRHALVFGNLNAVLDHVRNAALLIENRKAMDLEVPSVAMLIMVDVFDERRLAGFLDRSDWTRMTIGVAWQGAAVSHRVACGLSALLHLASSAICQSNVIVSHIDYVERIRQRIEDGLKQIITRRNGPRLRR